MSVAVAGVWDLRCRAVKGSKEGKWCVKMFCVCSEAQVWHMCSSARAKGILHGRKAASCSTRAPPKAKVGPATNASPRQHRAAVARGMAAYQKLRYQHRHGQAAGLLTAKGMAVLPPDQIQERAQEPAETREW